VVVGCGFFKGDGRYLLYLKNFNLLAICVPHIFQ